MKKRVFARFSYPAWLVGFAGFLTLAAQADGVIGFGFGSVTSDGIAAANVYASLHLTYEAEKAQLTAETYLRKGGLAGPTLRLSSSGSALFDGRVMAEVRKRFLDTTRYVAYTDTRDPLPGYTFGFVLGQGPRFSAQVPLRAVRVSVPNADVFRSQPWVVKWEGPALAAGETIRFSIHPVHGPYAEASVEARVRGATQVEFPVSELSKLPAGESTLRAIRVGSTTLPARGFKGARSLVTWTGEPVLFHLK
jgi:hypothetical protein